MLYGLYAVWCCIAVCSYSAVWCCMAVWRQERGGTGRVRCMERNTAKYSEIQPNSIQDAIQQSCASRRLIDRPCRRRSRWPSWRGGCRSGWRRPSFQAAHQQHSFEASSLVRGHEAAIRLVDAGRYTCAFAARRRCTTTACSRPARAFSTFCVTSAPSSIQPASSVGSRSST